MPRFMSLPDALGRARAIAHDVLSIKAARVDEARLWPADGLRALQEAGLCGLVLPVDIGGLGQGLLALAQTCEILGEACGSTAMCFGMHCVGSAVLSAKATHAQKHALLVPIAEGRHLTSLALSEPGTGAHFYFPQTTLTRIDAEHYALTGTKSFVTNGGYADSYVVSTVAAEPDAPIGKFSCVVVAANAPGLTVTGSWEGLGMRGNASCSLALQQVRVPRTHLLGQEGDQLWYVFEVVAPYFLMAMAGTYLGIATAALRESIAHLKARHHTHSGRRLAEQPILQHKLGCLWAEVERTRCLVYAAASLGDAGDAQALPAILASKAEVADCVVHVVNDVMTLMGGIAYGSNARLGRYLRDARAAHVMTPTTDILRTWTGRALLGLPLLAD